MKLQIVWWWRQPTIKWWKYPVKTSTYYEYFTQPIFWGLYLGIFEIRLLPKFVVCSGLKEEGKR